MQFRYPPRASVVAARIDRLEEDAKQVLEVASVIGREISISILERVCGFDPSELSQAVQHLRRSELLYDVPPFEQRLLAFRHPLIQEVALSVIAACPWTGASFNGRSGDRKSLQGSR